jgi:hypothetical protein
MENGEQDMRSLFKQLATDWSYPPSVAIDDINEIS